jgi:hypothetical protein
MDTERLIRTLAGSVEPVTPLRPPFARAAWWACAAGSYIALLVLVVPPRIDPATRLHDVRFLAEQGAAFLTGVAAAFAALASGVPGYRRSVVWLPFAFAAVWMTLAAVGAMYAGRSSAALLFSDWRCLPATLIGSAAPATAIGLMLRRGVALTPRLTAALGALAAAGVGNIGICFFQPHHSNLAVLVWHCGIAFLLTAIASMMGRQFLRWPIERCAPAAS